MTEVYGHLAALAWIICQGLSATRYLSLGAYRRESRLNKTIISYIALQISCLIFFFFHTKILLNIKFSSSLNQQTFLLLARTVPSLPNHKITRLKPQQIFRDLIWKYIDVFLSLENWFYFPNISKRLLSKDIAHFLEGKTQTRSSGPEPVLNTEGDWLHFYEPVLLPI